MVVLRREVVASSELSLVDKNDLHAVLDVLRDANLYGQISLVSKLKEVLSRHAAFKAGYAEFSLRSR